MTTRVTLAVAIMVAGVSAWAGRSAAARQQLEIVASLDLYAAGRHGEFDAAVSRHPLTGSDLFRSSDVETKRWIEDGRADGRERRVWVAATVALEFAHLLRDEPADRPGRYLVWAAQLVRSNQPAIPTETERRWYLAALSGMEELDEPWVLPLGTESPSSVFDPIARSIGRGGLLASAIQRFPQEPRFPFARLQLSENPVFEWAFSKSWLTFVSARASARVKQDPQSASERWALGLRDQAARDLRQYSRIPDLIRSYRALEGHDELRSEIALRIGYLEAAQMNWAVAVQELRRLPELTDDSFVLYLGEYFTGRILQNTGDRTGAIGAFERALKIVPDARSAATQVAVELLLSENAMDRDRASALLRGAYTDSAPPDPWYLYWHGDARLWRSRINALRESLR